MGEPLIRNVAGTAFMVAAHRAIESARRDALFHDPLAARHAGEHGQRIAAHGMAGMSAMTGWVVAIRTCIIDERPAGAAAQHAADRCDALRRMAGYVWFEPA